MTSAPTAAEASLELLLELLQDPRAPVSRASAESALDVHIADSLAGLELEELERAGRIADLGSGAGLPGLVLAACRPAARFDLIESLGRKCAFLGEAIERMGLRNASVVCRRSEEWAAGEGREAYDAVTARAVGTLATVAELASPLLREGGVLAAWKGARSPEEEGALARAAERLAMEPLEIRAVRPYSGSRDRHIHLLRKNGPTPNGLPRRPGMAAKRPFGSEPNV
ncbi:MAG TPA: 16S rRNA (guanine(527)-N(7))-methyltransferase RsmG [Candidatus Eisenbacteria bacterium]|nr:16S rRNA (guanine(527)-N(7))-methyltransferase RsmG [Candidatus Eisenbacteria bacterium]